MMREITLIATWTILNLYVIVLRQLSTGSGYHICCQSEKPNLPII
jgi:hypothetical protein